MSPLRAARTWTASSASRWVPTTFTLPGSSCRASFVPHPRGAPHPACAAQPDAAPPANAPCCASRTGADYRSTATWSTPEGHRWSRLAPSTACSGLPSHPQKVLPQPAVEPPRDAPTCSTLDRPVGELVKAASASATTRARTGDHQDRAQRGLRARCRGRRRDRGTPMGKWHDEPRRCRQLRACSPA